MIIGKICSRAGEMDRSWIKNECKRSRGCRSLLFLGAVFCVILCLMTGCVTKAGNRQKLRDIEFTVLDKDTIPPELTAQIDGEQTEPFFMTYADQGYLYIARGYGERPTSGYSVEVNALYETEDALHVHTNLLGPEKGEETKDAATFPYVVIQLEYIEKEVLLD